MNATRLVSRCAKGLLICITSIGTLAGMSCLLASDTRHPACSGQGAEKKMIELGWDSPTIEYLSTNIATMKKNAAFFDGLACWPGEALLFVDFPWSEDDLMLSYARNIPSGYFNDIFIRVEASSNVNQVDWFDDSLWSTILGNAELLSKLLAAGPFAGLVIDPEFYNGDCSTTDGVAIHSPWYYQYDGVPYYAKSFDDVKAKVRLRGKALVEALQKYKPELAVMLLAGASIAYDYTGGDLANLATCPYALLPAFIDGMLDGINSGSTLIDGNEGHSYHLDETTNYDTNYDYIEKADLAFLENSSKWAENGRIAYAIYADYVAGYLDDEYYPALRPYGSAYYSKWMRHNAYNSLLHSDRYVWVYGESGSAKSTSGEKMDWWSVPQANLPEGIGEDLSFGKETYAGGAALFDMYKPDPSAEGKAQFVENPGFTLAYDRASPKVCLERSGSTAVESIDIYANSLLLDSYSDIAASVDLSGIERPSTVFARVYFDGGKHVGTNAILVE